MATKRDTGAHDDETLQVTVDDGHTAEGVTLDFQGRPLQGEMTIEEARAVPAAADFGPTSKLTPEDRVRHPVIDSRDLPRTELKRPDAPPPGAPRLANYRVISKLGDGSMGVVYEGVHNESGQRVAIKQLRKAASEKAALVRRFLAEAIAGSRVKHPGVAEVYDHGQDADGVPFLVMELLVGEDLGKRLKRTKLTFDETVTIAREIALVIVAAHARDIVHRDLKPENVFLLASGPNPLKVLDFGVAKFMNDALNLNATTTGQMIGTPYYMSPEQCLGEGVEPRSDIYALGCMIYEMVAGRVPFTGNLVSVVTGHRERKPKPLSQYAPDVPAGLGHLIESMMAKRVADRPASMVDVVSALQTLAVGQAASAPQHHERSADAAAGVGQLSHQSGGHSSSASSSSSFAMIPRLSESQPHPAATTSSGRTSATATITPLTMVVAAVVVLAIGIAVGVFIF